MPHNDNLVFINKMIPAEKYFKNFVCPGISLRILGQLYWFKNYQIYSVRGKF